MTNANLPVSPPERPSIQDETRLLQRFMLLSLAAALVTITLKSTAAGITGSVGFLSDAMESLVNLAAAGVALIALGQAVRPADHDHNFGHGKAEYFSSVVEGALIFVAAGAIVVTAVPRLFDPQPLEQPGLGVVLSIVASVLNLIVGQILIRKGRQFRSITLEADGQHLMTDVWTSVGVLAGIILVALTGWEILDPIIALLVGVNILITGYGLIRRSVVGLLSAAMPPAEVGDVELVLDAFRGADGVTFKAPRTVESGRFRFIYLDMQVPGGWTVDQAHAKAHEVMDGIDAVLPYTETFVHVEPHEIYAESDADAGELPR